MTAIIDIQFGGKEHLFRAVDELFSSALPPNLCPCKEQGNRFELYAALDVDYMGVPDWKVETFPSVDDAKNACMNALKGRGKVGYISKRAESTISVSASIEYGPRIDLDLCRDPTWRDAGVIPAADRDFDEVRDVIQRVPRMGMTGIGWRWMD